MKPWSERTLLTSARGAKEADRAREAVSAQIPQPGSAPAAGSARAREHCEPSRRRDGRSSASTRAADLMVRAGPCPHLLRRSLENGCKLLSFACWKISALLTTSPGLRRPYLMSRNTNSVTQSALKDTKTSKRSRADIIIARAYPLEEGGSAPGAISSPTEATSRAVIG